MEWIPLPHMQEYLDELEALERDPDYRRTVKVGLCHFGLFAKAEGITHPDEITRLVILRFQVFLSEQVNGLGQQLKMTYRQQLMKYVRAWINWMFQVGYLDANPWVRIKVGRQTKVPKPLEEDEVSRLFDAHRTEAFRVNPFYFHRREVVLVLLYGWGLRIHELAAITVSSMDARLDFVTVINKGGTTKEMPYGDSMKGVVLRYLKHRTKYAQVGIDNLLIDRMGKALSTDMIYKIVVELGAKAGVTINPHRLRDTFGTVMLDSDVPVERLMKMMGHTNRAQTLAYARVGDPTIKAEHDRVMNPLIDRLLERHARP
jgi:integrase/recombinase XerD